MTPDKIITLTIDGKAISVPSGTSILDAARQNGIEIPTLCYDPRLPAYASCLVCVVEMELNNRSRLSLSCTTEALDGMKVDSCNEKVRKARKNALDMLLSNHFADCRGACYENCPANVDVQGYLALANSGKYLEALELIRETNPLPLVCGRVCVHYCEAACRRNDIDSPVAVNFVKRYVADLMTDKLPRPVPPSTNGHKVAIVGGGPAGLTAAYFLARRGFQVKIFEAHPKLGGMLRYGIPDYRLSGEVLDKEIQHILDYGIDAQVNTRLGKDFTLDDLKRQGFESIYLALGSQKAKKMRIKDEETPGVLDGIGFLEKVKKAGPPDLKGHVVVVGGGNTAIDASRTALRCNATKVSILYRRTREEMPADDVEIRDAIEEGVDIQFLIAPVAVIAENDRVKALRCQRMQLGEPDASGRRSPVAVEGSDFDIPCDTIIAAIGQDSDLNGLKGNEIGDPEVTRWNTIYVNEQTFATSLPGVFAGGDVVTGPAAAIDAIGSGRKAAMVIEGYLKDGVSRAAPTEFLSKKTALAELPGDFFEDAPREARATMQQAPAESRITNFKEVDYGIAPVSVATESFRCLTCGCSDVFTCKLKEYAGQYGADQKRYQGKVKQYKVDRRHPLITLDQNKCVLCGLCVRTCDRLLGVGALGFVNRGFDIAILPTMGRALQDTNCIACGNCIEVCPTGAITFNLGVTRPGPWRTFPSPSVCSFCGVGCGLVFNKANERVWTVTAQKEDDFTLSELCVRGRFGHKYLMDGERVKEPRIKTAKGQTAVDLEEALANAISGLKNVTTKYGRDSLAFLVSPRSTNEEIALTRKLAEAFGTRYITSLYKLGQDESNDLDNTFGITASTLPGKDVEKADVIVLVNSNVTEENPVLGFRVRRAVANGAALVAISSTELGIQDAVSLWIDARRGTSTQVLGAVAGDLIRRGIDLAELQKRVAGVDEFISSLPDMGIAEELSSVPGWKIEKLAELLSDPSKNVVFIYNADSMLDKSPGDLHAIAGILLLTGRIGKAKNGLLLARQYSNSQGYHDLLGDLPLKGLKEALQSGRIKGFFLLGEDLAGDETLAKQLSNAEFVVAMDLLETGTTNLADVVLPGSAFAESEGSITSFDRKVQTFNRAFEPLAGMTGWEIMTWLVAGASGSKAYTLDEVRRQIAALNPRYHRLIKLGIPGWFHWNETSDGGELLFATSFLTPDAKAHMEALPQIMRTYSWKGYEGSAIEYFYEEKVEALL